jgi:RHS repeat-associated protein
MQMQLSSGTPIPDGILAAIALRNEKPRLGVPSRNPALHQGIDAANSTIVLGLQSTAALNRIGSRCTGKERDTESGLDYFGARHYDSSMGRFMSPDPTGLAYANPNNPQSLNLYGYALNNPLMNVDPTGTTCQTNQDDGSVYDDEDGLGCASIEQEDATNPSLNNFYYNFSGNVNTLSDESSAALSQVFQSNSSLFNFKSPTAGSGCIPLSSAGQAITKGLGAAANLTNRTIGFGLGGSVGAGTGTFGFNASISAQIVASPDGTSGLAVSYISPTVQGMFGVASGGLGGLAGAQISASTVGTVADLGGDGLNAGVFLADGAGVGFDTTFGVANGELTQQINLTLGFGAGGAGHGAARTTTNVTPFCGR